jgi:hypothetical protein
MQGIDLIIERLEKQLSRALKASGIVLGTTVNRSEADANRQWELQAAAVKALQHYCEGLLENLLSVSMQAKGIQCRVVFRFAELRAAELLRDAQVEAMKIANARSAYEAGYISQDEAANMAVLHDADVPAPRNASASEPADIEKDDNDGVEELDQEQEETNRYINNSTVFGNGHY